MYTVIVNKLKTKNKWNIIDFNLVKTINVQNGQL